MTEDWLIKRLFSNVVRKATTYTLVTAIQILLQCLFACLFAIDPLSLSLHCSQLWGAFAKSRKTNISFMSVRPSVRIGQVGSHWMDFHEISYLITFRKFLKKIRVSLNSDKNNGYFTYTCTTTSRSFLLRMRNVSDKCCAENQNKHFMSSNFFFPPKVIPFTK